MRLVLFLLLELVMLPLQLLAVIVYTIKIRRKTSPANISGTANEPLFTRLMMHKAGTREDEAAVRLAPHLPALGPVVASLIGTLGLAFRWTGYRTKWIAYPTARPTTMMSFLTHRTEFFDRLMADALDPKGEHPVNMSQVRRCPKRVMMRRSVMR